MSDIKTQMPVKLTDNTYTAVITSNNALKVDATWGTQAVTGTLVVTSTNLDVRDLTAASDTVTATGTVTAVPSGTQDVTGTVVVTSNDLDIRELSAVTDTVVVVGTVDISNTVPVSGTVEILTTVPVSGSVEVTGTVASIVSGTVDIGTVSGSVTVTALDFDIRDLSGSTDTVGVAGTVPVIGSVEVTGTVTAIPSGTQIVTGTVVANVASSGVAEDDEHVTGDVGTMILGVRNDGNVAFSGTDGDYTPINVTENGLVKVQIADCVTTVTVAGTIDVNSISSTVGVTGTVEVSNLPAAVAPGDVINYYDSDTVTATQTGTFTYTTAGAGTFFLKGVMASSSGAPCRVDVLSGTVPVSTAFYSAAVPMVQLNYPQPVPISATTELTVLVRNDADDDQDVFVSIMGYQGV